MAAWVEDSGSVSVALFSIAKYMRDMGRNARKTDEWDTDALAARLHSVAIHMLRRVRRDDPMMGLTPSRASALSVLVFGGARTIGELASAEQVKAPTMTRLVSALEAAGYVTRQADAADGRVVRVAATAKGQLALEEGRHRRVMHMLELLARLKPEEVAVVAAAVGTLERALSEDASR